MRSELGGSVPLLLLFVIGLAAGVWLFIAPWTVGYPMGSGWTSSVWTSIWAGGVLTAVSAISIVALLARVVHVAQRRAPDAD
jgi:hypothetical protein